ncbi:MAG: hypothetical protein HY778_16925 [Betaproteobacteria bacterium]|nr:hypothetical protein [Betaproteobacteria bacterium]
MLAVRVLFVILAIANGVLFAYGRGVLTAAPAGEPDRKARQHMPERIRVVPDTGREPAPAPTGATESGRGDAAPSGAPAEAPQASPPAGASPPAPAAPAAGPGPRSDVSPPNTAVIPAALARGTEASRCAAVEGLSREQAQRLSDLVRARGLDVKLTERASEASSWWVHLPPQPDRKAVDRRLEELDRAGVKEHFVIAQGGQNALSISLGLFRSQQTAQGFVRRLRERGVGDVLLTPRHADNARVTVELRGPGSAVQTAIAGGFAGARTTTCALGR